MSTPPPRPRPPARPQPAAATQLAQILHVTEQDRAALILGRRDHGASSARLVWQGPRGDALLVAVDLFVDLFAEARTLAEPLVVVAWWKLVRQLRSVGFHDPQLLVGARPGAARIPQAHQLGEQWRAAEKSRPPARVARLVATDASVGLGRGTAGIAWVDELGRQGSRYLRSRDVLACELRAILCAIQALHVLTDSQVAAA